MKTTLFFYLARQFRQAFYIILAIVVAVFLVSNYIDLLSKVVDKDVSFFTITKLAFAKIPYLIQEALPFLIFIAAILAFSRLSRNNEYTIIKASGVSIWQLLWPYLSMTLLIGVIFVAVVNPIATSMMDYMRKTSNKVLHGNSGANLLSFSHSGLWFIDKTNDVNEKRIVHAQYLNNKSLELIKVSYLFFDNNFTFIQRLDAESAILDNGQWKLENVRKYTAHQLAENINEMNINTNFKDHDLRHSFIEPQSISVWQLPHFIAILQSSGYSALQHSAYFYKLILRPFLICGLVLIAASFSLRPARFISSLKVVSFGILSGFLLFFANELLNSLGASGTIPNIAAAFISTTSICLLGGTLVLHIKDG